VTSKNEQNLDLAAWDLMLHTLIPLPTSEDQVARVSIGTRPQGAGWSGTAVMQTDEGYLNRSVEVLPCAPDDPADSWLMNVSWSTRDCDGLYDGGHTARLDFDGLDEHGNPKVTVATDMHSRSFHDHSAERMGY
jgi:hypothetical protein